MTSIPRLRRLAVLALVVAFAASGGLLAPADAEDTFDCSSLLDCENVDCLLVPEPLSVFVIGPCDDGNGQYVLEYCGREGANPCRLTS